jgi:hypothetical protein
MLKIYDNFQALTNLLTESESQRNISSSSNWDNVLILEVSNQYLKMKDKNEDCNCGVFLRGLVRKILEVEKGTIILSKDHPIKGITVVYGDLHQVDIEDDDPNVRPKIYIPYPKKALKEHLMRNAEIVEGRNKFIHDDTLEEEIENYKFDISGPCDKTTEFPFRIADIHKNVS